jgi:hypothetical protein
MLYRSSLWFGLLAFAMCAGLPEDANGSSATATENRRAVGWRLPGGETVRAIHESADNPVPTFDRSPGTRPLRQAKKLSSTDRAIQARMTNTSANAATTATVSAMVIHSPPVDGFVPYTRAPRPDDYMPSGSLHGGLLSFHKTKLVS